MNESAMRHIERIDGATFTAKMAVLNVESALREASNPGIGPVDRAFALGRIHASADLLKDAADAIADWAQEERGE